MQNCGQTVICLMGPTASGKTALALELIRRQQLNLLPFNLPSFEIISVDSGMIYRGMDIGTAKPTKQEQTIAPHRLIDICDPSESYSVAQFRHDALREINDIFQHGRIPLLVGGTMLYFKMLQQGISALPPADTAIRKRLLDEANVSGWGKMHEKLQQIDPLMARRLMPQDSQRIQRALEVYEITGQPMSRLLDANPPQALPYNIINIAMATPQRAILQERIQLRLQQMIKQGLVEEVECLFKRSDLHVDLPAMRAVGYRQVWQYLAGKITYADMLELIFIATRQLAKRQLTWLKNWPELIWINTEGFSIMTADREDDISNNMAMPQLIKVLMRYVVKIRYF